MILGHTANFYKDTGLVTETVASQGKEKQHFVVNIAIINIFLSTVDQMTACISKESLLDNSPQRIYRDLWSFSSLFWFSDPQFYCLAHSLGSHQRCFRILVTIADHLATKKTDISLSRWWRPNRA